MYGTRSDALFSSVREVSLVNTLKSPFVLQWMVVNAQGVLISLKGDHEPPSFFRRKALAYLTLKARLEASPGDQLPDDFINGIIMATVAESRISPPGVSNVHFKAYEAVVTARGGLKAILLASTAPIPYTCHFMPYVVSEASPSELVFRKAQFEQAIEVLQFLARGENDVDPSKLIFSTTTVQGLSWSRLGSRSLLKLTQDDDLYPPLLSRVLEPYLQPEMWDYPRYIKISSHFQALFIMVSTLWKLRKTSLLQQLFLDRVHRLFTMSSAQDASGKNLLTLEGFSWVVIKAGFEVYEAFGDKDVTRGNQVDLMIDTICGLKLFMNPMQASSAPPDRQQQQIFSEQTVRPPPFSRRRSSQIGGGGGNRPMTIACAACRRKKIKCDSRRPSCSQCLEDGQASCMYVEWKKTGLPRGYVRNLEAQIQALKAENHELRSHQGRTHSGSHTIHAQATTQYEFPSDDILPSGLVDQTSPYAPSDHDILMQDPFDVARLAISELLTAEDRNNLCTLYFTRCHPFVPILHRPSFSVEKDAHVSLSVFALAARHHPSLTSKSDIFYSLAKQSAQATFINPDMSTLAALILQAIYEIGMPNSSVHALTTVGSALSLASAFRLLRMEEREDGESKPNRWMDPPVDWVEEEGRRRALLMVLSLSRWMATIQEREMGFPVKREITVMLPISDEAWFADPASQPATRPQTAPITALHHASDAGPFARFVQALGLFAKVSDFSQTRRMRSSSENAEELSRIDNIIQAYLGSFPDSWRTPHLEGEYLLDPTTLALAHSALLLLHHPIACRDSHGYSKSQCLASAEEILDVAYVIQDVPNAGNYLLPHPLVLAARVRLLELVHRKGHYRGRDMDLIVKALLTFGRYWGMQEKLTEHAGKIEANTVPFSEPLTHVIPTTNHPVSRPKTAQFVPSSSSSSSVAPRWRPPPPPVGEKTNGGSWMTTTLEGGGGEGGGGGGVVSAPAPGEDQRGNGIGEPGIIDTSTSASLEHHNDAIIIPSPNDNNSNNTIDASAIFSSDIIFDWAMGLGSEALDGPCHHQ
ncbi:hypothetical protein AYL99_10991 [Fonsecaea erecta]|uniref:Zn(2)-C6 fungal-type domain-containing protein n=1 Tax=Fonsecaea erecta TaxID=1367422 RepID=A0A178Z5U8_9EURO|nr:hypothetical protein AYL99_10991 [Fonsecaea erecta]OAP54543.1 hypothetical protein AYL99_10991 [Fonsecaea erecta]